jgi:hypothetical protein
MRFRGCRLLPCQSLKRDEHMGVSMGMMHSPNAGNNNNNNICFYASAHTYTNIFTSAAHSTLHLLGASVSRALPSQIDGWAKTAKPPVPSFRF